MSLKKLNILWSICLLIFALLIMKFIRDNPWDWIILNWYYGAAAVLALVAITLIGNKIEADLTEQKSHLPSELKIIDHFLPKGADAPEFERIKNLTRQNKELEEKISELELINLKLTENAEKTAKELFGVLKKYGHLPSKPPLS